MTPLRARVLRWASISPDGRRLTFSALGRVYVADLADGRARRLTDGESREYMPRFSPDGRTIAFVTWSDTELGHVVTVPVQGGTPTVLTSIAGRYANPVWSNDGQRLAFLRGGGAEQRGEQPEAETYLDVLWMPVSGGEARYVTSTVSSNSIGFPMRFYPVIAFDVSGSRIYYSRWSRGGEPGSAPKSTLYSVRLDGTERRGHMSFIAFDEVVPSPDSRRVAFVRREQVWVATLPEYTAEPVELDFSNPAVPSTIRTDVPSVAIEMCPLVVLTVPMVTPRACRAPRAAPCHHSPRMAQLASLSRVAGYPSASAIRCRSGRSTQARFGVRNTTPVEVSSGPGAPMPTPMTSASGCFDRVSSMTVLAMIASRARTPSGPSSERVGWLSTVPRPEPSSRTAPTTRLVPPMSIPIT